MEQEPKENRAVGSSAQASGSADWLNVAGFIAAQCPLRRDRQPYTAALKRSMRGANPNRPKKGNNARAVNAKATKRAAKEAKKAKSHNQKLFAS